MKVAYLDTIVLVERLHRLFLDVLKVEIDRLGIRDINNVQCFLLYNIGDEELSIGELTQRGYYLGSNVTYNLKKMIESGYVHQERSTRDRRSSYIRLTKKGLDMRANVHRILDGHIDSLKKRGEAREEYVQAANVLRNLETFWSTLLATSARSLAS